MKNKERFDISLLLLTCGTNAGFHIAKRFKLLFGGRIKLVGTDINQRWSIPSIQYLDEFYQVPLSSDENYYQIILDICRSERVNYLFPIFDEDQHHFYAQNPDLLEMGICSFGIPASIRTIYRSKEAMTEFLYQHHFPVPQLFSKDTIQNGYDYFCKPIDGYGSYGAKKYSGKEIRLMDTGRLMIQEVCQEPEITLECFNYKGFVYSIARERLATKAGVCTKARVYKDDNLQKIAQDLSRTIELPILFNLQFMQNSKGDYVITDVNLRVAGGMSISYAAGWDEVGALGKIILGEEDVFSSVDLPIKEQYVVRAYEDIVTRVIDKRIAFDLDGTLLDSRNRHLVVMTYVLSENGIKLDTSDYLSYKSDGYSNLSWLRMKGVDDILSEQINEQWKELIEEERFLSEDVLYNNTLDVLKSISGNNYLMLLTARNNMQTVQKQIDQLGLRQFFDDVFIVPSNGNTAELKAKILSENSIDVFYGDTESDLKAARLSNCEFFVSTRGFRSLAFWQQYNVSFAGFLRK